MKGAICINFRFLDPYKQSKKDVVSPVGNSQGRAPRLPGSKLEQRKVYF